MQAQDTPVRKYALTRVATGDYIFPSNDGKTIWRVAKYEDGPSHGLDEMPRDRELWGLWKWREPIGLQSPYVDTGDWNRWEFWEGWHETRQEAIDAALKAGAR
jgi:hypothetical protein